VLTNQERDEVFDAITNHVLDLLLAQPEMDWPALLAASQAADERRQQSKLARVLASRTLGRDSAVDSTPYEGTYTDSWYGEVSLWRSGGPLRIRFGRTPGLNGDLEPWSADTFLVRWDERLLNGDALIEFHMSPQGAADRATMRRVSSFEAPAFDFNDLHLIRRSRAEESTDSSSYSGAGG
jgi:hypothetical protein